MTKKIERIKDAAGKEYSIDLLIFILYKYADFSAGENAAY